MMKKIVSDWLNARVRGGKISRNTIAVGIVVLDTLRQQCPITDSELFSKGGELKGSRGGSLSKTLERYGIPAKFLKEATTRQAHQDARQLAENLSFGKKLARMQPGLRDSELTEAIQLLAARAHEWLSRQPIRINCDRQLAPSEWINSILQKAQGRSGGVVEQHLIGAKLQKRHPTRSIPNFPSHAADFQTKRCGDFAVEKVSYHVTATDGKEAIARCKENIESGAHPVLLVPKRFLLKAGFHAESEGLQHRLLILSIEDFLIQNIIEMSTEAQQDFFATLKAIIEEYNRRLLEVETDLSLRIELQ